MITMSLHATSSPISTRTTGAVKAPVCANSRVSQHSKSVAALPCSEIDKRPLRNVVLEQSQERSLATGDECHPALPKHGGREWESNPTRTGSRPLPDLKSGRPTGDASLP